MKTNPKAAVATVRVGNITLNLYETGYAAHNGKCHQQFSAAYSEGGKRRHISASKLTAAMDKARTVAQRLHSGRREVSRLTTADEESYIVARRELEGIGIPLLDAVKQFTAATRALPAGASLFAAARDYVRRHPENTPSRTVNEVIAELLTARKQDKARPRYRKDLHSTLAANQPGSTERKRNSFGNTFGSTRISIVTTVDMDAWLRARGVAARTRIKLVTVLRTLFNFGKAAGYLPKGIATEADGLTTPKVQGAENIAIFTPGEMQKLLTGGKAHMVTDEHRLWLALGGFAGLCTAELLRLEWGKHVQIERGLIQVSGDIAKTNGRRIITMQANLMAWLAPYSGRTGKVFAPRADERCHEYAKRMGVEWKANGLRHSFISYLCATTRNLPAVAMEAGNSVTVINKHYRELTTEAEGKAWFAIVPQAPVVAKGFGRVRILI